MTLARIALSRAVGSKTGKNTETYSRLACLLTLAILAGWSMASIAQDLALVTLPHAGRLYLSVVFIFQIIGCTAILISASYSDISSVTRLAMTLPLSRQYVGFIGLLPPLLLAGMLLLMTLPPIATLFHQLGLNWPLLIMAAMLGTISSFGILGFSHSKVSRIILPTLVLTGEAGLLYFVQHRLLSPFGPTIFACILLLCILYSIGALLNVHTFQNYYKLSYLNIRAANVRTHLPAKWWMGVCAYRSRVNVLGLSLTFLMSTLIAWAIVHYRLPHSLAATFGAFFLAVVASDLRGIFQLARPPEIAALDGTHAFVRRTFFASFILGVLSTCPLILLAFWPSDPMPLDRLISMLLLATAIGTSLSHILATSHRTISLPFLVMLVAFALLDFLPSKAVFTDLAWWWQDSLYLMIVVVFRVTAGRIEYKRNPYMWRSRNQ